MSRSSSSERGWPSTTMPPPELEVREPPSTTSWFGGIVAVIALVPSVGVVTSVAGKSHGPGLTLLSAHATIAGASVPATWPSPTPRDGRPGGWRATPHHGPRALPGDRGVPGAGADFAVSSQFDGQTSNNTDDTGSQGRRPGCQQEGPHVVQST